MLKRSFEPNKTVQDLAVVCLTTANFDLVLRDVCQGKRTVIDFWTAQCTRCPEALDKLNALAEESSSSGNVQFISICCGKELDPAREILEGTRHGRWNKLLHYFMDFEAKEEAKRLLGFRQVPFYVVLDERGEVVYANAEFDTNSFVPPKATTCHSPTSVFIIDDLDF